MSPIANSLKLCASNLGLRFRALLLILLSGTIAGGLLNAAEPDLTDEMIERAMVSPGEPARLDAVLAKARRGEPICVAAIGGSITAGGDHTKDPARRYVQQIAKWFETSFPGLKVKFVNAGIGATDSAYGALRVKRDVIDRHPDLVVVEYAVNDTSPPPGRGDSYEGVLRQLLSSSRDLAVIELFFMHKDGKSAQAVQEDLGRHYGLPMISFKAAMWPEFQAGRLKWEGFYDDVVHPSNEGHDITSALLRKFLCDSLARLPPSNQELPRVTDIPAPLISDAYERCVMFRGEDFKPTSSMGWTHAKSNFWECSPSGGTLEYEVPGQFLYLGQTIPIAAKGSLEVSIDGAPPVLVGVSPLIAGGLSNGIHKVKLMVRPYQAGGDASKDVVKLWWGGGAGCQQ